jgi:hypothetical protein
MGFTLYLMPAEGQHFDSTAVREAFGEFLSPHPLGVGYLVCYDSENESTIDLQEEDDGRIGCVSVERPCGDERLFVALHRLLSSVPSFMTYPDEDLPCLVATPEAWEAVREHHPEMGEGLRLCLTPKDLSSGLQLHEPPS